MRKIFLIAGIAAICLMLSGCGENNPEPEPPELPNVGEGLEFAGIEWQVLYTQDNYVLLLSTYVLGQRRFHGTSRAVSWEASAIRYYLNNDFLRNFSEDELAIIIAKEVINNENPWHGTDGGEPTVDKVFLLSIEEMIKYFGDSGQLADRRHPSNTATSVYDIYDELRLAYDLETGFEWWYWLRTVGETTNRAAFIGACGRIGIRGVDVTNEGGVRPALWIDFFMLYDLRSSDCAVYYFFE